MNRKKCYCSNKFCKCLFGCGCATGDSGIGKCMCCRMEENNKKLRRRGNVVTETTNTGEGGECGCDFNIPSFYDIIVYNVGENKYWSCRYGCSVTIDSEVDIKITDDDWQSGAVDNGNQFKKDIVFNITYNSNPEISSSVIENILIIREEDIKHVWCKVN